MNIQEDMNEIKKLIKEFIVKYNLTGLEIKTIFFDGMNLDRRKIIEEIIFEMEM